MVDGFLRKIGEVFGSDDQQDNNEVRPASEDPYGDPADQGMFGDVRPASEDPYGDPADIASASEDPYGDPADQ